MEKIRFKIALLTIAYVFTLSSVSISILAEEFQPYNGDMSFLIPINKVIDEKAESENKALMPQKEISTFEIKDSHDLAFNETDTDPIKLPISDNFWQPEIEIPSSDDLWNNIDEAEIIVDVAIKTEQGTIVMTNKNVPQHFSNGDDNFYNFDTYTFMPKIYKTALFSSSDYLMDITVYSKSYRNDEEKSFEFNDIPVTFGDYKVVDNMNFSRSALTPYTGQVEVTLISVNTDLDKDALSLTLVDIDDTEYAVTTAKEYNRFSGKREVVFTLTMTETIDAGKNYYIKINSSDEDIIVRIKKTDFTITEFYAFDAYVLSSNILDCKNGVVEFKTEGMSEKEVILKLENSDNEYASIVSDDGRVIFTLNQTIEKNKRYFGNIKVYKDQQHYDTYSCYFDSNSILPIYRGINHSPELIKQGVNSLTDFTISFHTNKSYKYTDISSIILTDGQERLADMVMYSGENQTAISGDFVFLPEKSVTKDMYIEIRTNDGKFFRQKVMTGNDAEINSHYNNRWYVNSVSSHYFLGETVSSNDKLKIMGYSTSDDHTFQLSTYNDGILETVSKNQSAKYKVTPTYGFLYYIEAIFDTPLQTVGNYNISGLYNSVRAVSVPQIALNSSFNPSSKKLTVGYNRRINMPDKSKISIKLREYATGDLIDLDLPDTENSKVCDLSDLRKGTYELVAFYDEDEVYPTSIQTNPVYYIPIEDEKCVVTFISDDDVDIIRLTGTEVSGSLKGKVLKVSSVDGELNYHEIMTLDLPQVTDNNKLDIPHLYFDEKLPNGSYVIEVTKNGAVLTHIRTVTIDKNTLSGKLSDSLTNKPISGAKIKIEYQNGSDWEECDLYNVDQENPQTSFLNGMYSVNLENGKYRLTIMHPDYEEKQITVAVPNLDANYSLNNTAPFAVVDAPESAAGNKIIVYFNKSLNADTLNLLKLTDNNGNEIECEFQLLDNNTTLLIKSKMDLASGSYKLLTNGIKDISGAVSDDEIDFQFNANISALQALTCERIGNTVTLTFDKDVDEFSVNSDSIYLELSGVKIDGNLQVNEKTVAFTVASNFFDGKTYIITVKDMVRSTENQYLSQNKTFSFTTETKASTSESQSTSGNRNNNANVISAPPVCDFGDLVNYEWAQEAIIELYNKGIIKGISDSEFAPQNNIKRADYMLLIIRMLGLNSNVTENFSDVPADKYYYREIGIAKAFGITDGIGNNEFNPEGFISRQDMFVLAHRVMKMRNVHMQASTQDDISDFSDYSLISDYALEAIASLVKNKMVTGSDNMINPLGLATRAETAVFINRQYSMIKG